MNPLFILSLILFLGTLQTGVCQNIIDNDELDLKLPPTELSTNDLDKLLNYLPNKKTIGTFEGIFTCVQRKLENQIKLTISNWPLMPFHHTLGISGYEVYFNHPDELFYSLSIALPYLSKDTCELVKKFLAEQAKILPAYSINGFDNQIGRPRESYDVPFNLRISGHGVAKSTFGVYAFWNWCYFTGDYEPAKAHYHAIKSRMHSLLDGDYKFDIYNADYVNDEAEKLNGDLAGIIGFIRLARLNGDDDAAKMAIDVGTKLLNLRINLERVNVKIVTKTSATKSLHIYKLARYSDLVPEICEGLREFCEGVAEKRVYAYRSARNGWYMAFGDRLIGGENYTNPLHFGRAIFCGAALIEKLDAEKLASFVDVPHCIGDLYFIEKCSLVLRSCVESSK